MMCALTKISEIMDCYLVTSRLSTLKIIHFSYQYKNGLRNSAFNIATKESIYVCLRRMVLL